MDLKNFNFPKLTGLDLVFPTLDTDKQLYAFAKEKGFDNKKNPYNKLFNELFYCGGKIEFKKDLDAKFKNDAWTYCMALMKSFAPKHEEKEAVCSYIMSELLEVNNQ